LPQLHRSKGYMSEGYTSEGHTPEGHTSEDRLELYALDRLSGTEIIQVEEHLIVCEPCRERLEQNAAFAFAVRDVLRQDSPVPVKASASPWERVFSKPWFGINLWSPQFAVGALACFVLVVALSWFGIRAGADSRLTPVASLQLIALRGDMQSVPATKALNLTLTDAPAGGAPFRIELVDSGGTAKWSGTPRPDAEGLKAHIARSFAAGTYFARLYDVSGKLIHEYGFRVVGS
jgi:hypothetical protein